VQVTDARTEHEVRKQVAVLRNKAGTQKKAAQAAALKLELQQLRAVRKDVVCSQAFHVCGFVAAS
jgi:hypothetical protein